MATECKKIRFMVNNYAGLTLNDLTISSEATGNEAVNALNDDRSSVWKPDGHFLIDSTNDTIYINDGSDKSATITNQSYGTPELLATEIQTQLNAVSSDWTVSYDRSGGTYKFTISNTSSVTLRLSVTTDAIWNTIGYTSTTNQTGTSFVANEQRNHTSEFLTFDFGGQLPVDFIGIISDVSTSFGVSTAGTITLKADNINDFTSPPLSLTLSKNEFGSFTFIDETIPIQTNRSFRFWRLEIIDIYNTGGPQGIAFGNIYLGDFQTTSKRNMSIGFNDKLVDPSDVSSSEAEVLYFDKKTKSREFNNVILPLMPLVDKDSINTIFNAQGITNPFYVSLDPSTKVSTNLSDLTRYVRFVNDPTYTEIKGDLWTTTLQFKEVI